MKKIFVAFLFVFGLFLSLASAASANEGVVRMAGKADADGRCFGTSIFIDGTYKLVMTCRGLQMALDPVLNKYVVWANIGEKKQRLGEVVNGKLFASIPDKFESLFVTLEADGYPTKPSINFVLNGSVEPIDFGKGTLNSAITTLTPTAMITGTRIDDRGAVVPTVTPSASLTGAVVAVGKAILFGFIILLILVGVMSFLARRKNL